MIGKLWPWWQLWVGVKPTLRSSKFAEIKASLEAKTAEAEKKREGEKSARVKAEKINEKLAAETAELEDALSRGDEMVKEMESKVKKLEADKQKVDRQVNDAGRQFQEEQDTCLGITNSMKKLVGDKKRFEE